MQTIQQIQSITRRQCIRVGRAQLTEYWMLRLRLRFRGHGRGNRKQITLRAGRGAFFLKLQQVATRCADHRGGHASKLRHLQAVTLIGRAFLDAVQKHDAVFVLDCVEVHVDGLPEFLREARQFSPREFRVVAAANVVEMLLDEESAHLAGLSDFIGKPISLTAEPTNQTEHYDIVLL